MTAIKLFLCLSKLFVNWSTGHLSLLLQPLIVPPLCAYGGFQQRGQYTRAPMPGLIWFSRADKSAISSRSWLVVMVSWSDILNPDDKKSQSSTTFLFQPVVNGLMKGGTRQIHVKRRSAPTLLVAFFSDVARRLDETAANQVWRNVRQLSSSQLCSFSPHEREKRYSQFVGFNAAPKLRSLFISLTFLKELWFYLNVVSIA